MAQCFVKYCGLCSHYFFLFLLGSQYLVSLGPMVWLLNHVLCFYWAPRTPFLRARWFGCSACFLFLLGSQYPVSLGPWLQLDDKSLAAATAVPVPVKWRRRRKTISPWLQLDEKSLAATTAVAVAVKYWRARTTSPIR